MAVCGGPNTECDGEVVLVGAGRAEEDDVLRLSDEGARVQVRNQVPVGGGLVIEVEVLPQSSALVAQAVNRGSACCDAGTSSVLGEHSGRNSRKQHFVAAHEADGKSAQFQRFVQGPCDAGTNYRPLRLTFLSNSEAYVCPRAPACR